MTDGGRTHSFVMQLLIFLGLFVLTSIAESFVLLCLYSCFPEAEGTALWPNLYATSGAVAVTFLFAFLLEKRGRGSLSVRVAKTTTAPGDYLLGLLFGAILASLATLFSVLTDAAVLKPLTGAVSVGSLLLFFFGFLLQGFSVELLCRGYLLSGFMKSLSLPLAVLLSSLAFSAIHLLNTGFSVLACINLTLFGVFAALLTLRRGSLWAAAGMHCAWNFTEGILFGVPVSGVAFNSSLFSAAVNMDKALINGGAFGPEGGLAVTLALALGIGYTLFFMEQKN